MHVARVRLERHTLAKISPSWSHFAIHESNCRMWNPDEESQSRVENPSLRQSCGTTQNSCIYTGIWIFITGAVQK